MTNSVSKRSSATKGILSDTRVTIRCAKCSALNRVPQDDLFSKLACGKCKSVLGFPKQPLSLSTSDNYDALVANWPETLLVVFIDRMCIYSKIIDPLIIELARKRAGKLMVLTVDIETEDLLAKRYKIEQTPTFIVYKNGEKINRADGAPKDKNDLVTWIEDLSKSEMNERPGALPEKPNQETGRLDVNKGELLNTETRSFSHAEAADDTVSGNQAEIDISPRCIKKVQTIQASLNEVLMEGCKRKDEKERRKPGGSETPPDRGRVLAEEQASQSLLNKEDIMALEKHLEGLKEVKGYKAAGIMDYTGEMLVSQSDDSNINLTLVGATFNDIFRAAHEASKKIGLDACRETVINTPKGVIVMRCSGVDAKAHFHIISIMANDGNHALMKMQIEKMVPAVMQELA